jgi:hypothetical protein
LPYFCFVEQIRLGAGSLIDRRRRTPSGATTAPWTVWTPPGARRRACSSGALQLGVHIGIDEIRADEFCAMLIIAEERDLLEREKMSGPRPSRSC